MAKDAIQLIKEELFPLTSLITPNLDETEGTDRKENQNIQDMLEAAKQLSHSYQTHILIKGGHLEGENVRPLISPINTYYIYKEKKIESRNLHGTGCTLSFRHLLALLSGPGS